MNTINDTDPKDSKEKYTGIAPYAIFLGGLIVVLILIKLLLDFLS
jgi:hypothetical protein